MAKLNFVRCTAIVVLICWSVLLPAFVLAQSQTATAIPTIDPATIPTIPPMAGSVVRGFVLDSIGNPIPNAVVTLWHDGKIWQHGKMIYTKADNPQTSYIYSDEPHPQEYALTGLFWYGLVEPGLYTLTAEKDGYKGSAIVSVGNELINNSFEGFSAPKIMVNVTLEGYHEPVLTQEQLSYTGAIAGTLQTYWGYGVIGVNMSVWQNGQLVTMPKNPRASHRQDFNGSKIDFLFEHLAPGQYMVVAEYSSPNTNFENVTVNVTDRVEVIDIVLSKMLNSITTTPSPSPSSTANPTASITPKSTPSLEITLVILSICVTGLLVSIFRKTK
jgi:hypothetical protein